MILNRLLIFIIMITVVGFLIASGCRRGDISENKTPGEKAFRQYCQSCHSLPKPTDKTDEQWPGIVKRYGNRAKLNSQTQALILRYLQNSN